MKKQKLLTMSQRTDLHATINKAIKKSRKAAANGKIDISALNTTISAIAELLWDHHRRFHVMELYLERKRLI